MSSMGEIRAEGEEAHANWEACLQALSVEALAFVRAARDAGTITQQECDLLIQQSYEQFMDDPYWPECPNVWEKRGVDKVYLVVAFHKSRRYGGAEEGGWWYDHLDVLTDRYAETHGRAFIMSGPMRDQDEAWEVARDLSAFEHGKSYNERNIVWRVLDHVPFAEGTRPVYC